MPKKTLQAAGLCPAACVFCAIFRFGDKKGHLKEDARKRDRIVCVMFQKGLGMRNEQKMGRR